MSTEHRFEIEPEGYNEPKRRSPWMTCFIGCLIVAGVMLIIAIILTVWVARNLRGWVADFGSMAVNEGIQASDLPPQEKAEIKVQVERVGNAFRDGSITVEQAGRIMQKVMESPLMPSLVVGVVDKQYLARSGLSDQEKADGRKTLQRFTRGLIDDKIDQKAIDAVMGHIATRKEDGNWELRKNVSDEDLRAALAEAKARADEAHIPEEPPAFDPSDEFKKIIDEAMKEPQSGEKDTQP